MWCGFTLKGDGHGHFEVQGWIADGELIDEEIDIRRHKLQFLFMIDQTMLSDTIKSLDKIIEEYPFKKTGWLQKFIKNRMRAEDL